jgi:hypothetical protein
MPVYMDFRSYRWGHKWTGSTEKVVQAVENYDDASSPMPPEVREFLLSVVRRARDVENLNGLVLKASGTWLEPNTEPKDGSARFPLELSIELRREKLYV